MLINEIGGKEKGSAKNDTGKHGKGDGYSATLVPRYVLSVRGVVLWSSVSKPIVLWCLVLKTGDLADFTK